MRKRIREKEIDQWLCGEYERRERVKLGQVIDLRGRMEEEK